MEKLLLRPCEVSELTGMGKSKTYELIGAGVIPSVRIGKSVRVPAERLRRWIQELQGDGGPTTTSSGLKLGKVSVAPGAAKRR